MTVINNLLICFLFLQALADIIIVVIIQSACHINNTQNITSLKIKNC